MGGVAIYGAPIYIISIYRRITKVGVPVQHPSDVGHGLLCLLGRRGAAIVVNLMDESIGGPKKCGMKVGRSKDPVYQDPYFGIVPPSSMPPLEPLEQ